MRNVILLLALLILVTAAASLLPPVTALSSVAGSTALDQPSDLAPASTKPKHLRLPNIASPTSLAGYHAPQAAAAAAGCTLLIVDDDWDYGSPNGGGRPYYASTLDALGFSYDVWDTVSQGDPLKADMAGYDVVVWFTGYAWEGGVFTTQNETQVGQYLTGGGSFVLSSQEYYGEADRITAFMEDYLGIATMIDDRVITTTVGIALNPIGDGLGPYTMVRPDDWDVYWPTGEFEGPLDDEATARAGASEPFRYDGPGNFETNATNFDGGAFKTTYLAWPFEWIDTVDERAEIMGAILPWMMCVSPVDLRPPNQTGSGIPGSQVIYDLTLINNLGSAETFDIAYDAAWTTTGPGAIGPIPSGGSQDFQVSVTIPFDANCYEADKATVIATAQSDPESSDTAALETRAEPFGTGGVTGTVFDANTDLGIPSAYIQLALEGNTYETYAGTDGSYSIDGIPACTYEGLFSAVGYYNQSGVPVPIVAEEMADLSVYLDASMPDLPTDPVSVDLLLDGTETFALTLANNGTGDLFFHIAELPDGGIGSRAPDAAGLVPDAAGLMPEGIDPQVYADLENAPEGAPNGAIKFLVYMADQADLSAAFAMEDRSGRGHYVLDTLRATAERTQADLKAELARAGIPYESFYIANALVIEIDPSQVPMHTSIGLVERIAARPDVAYVGPASAVPSRTGPLQDATRMQPVPDNEPQAQHISWAITHTRAISVWSEYEIFGQNIVVASIDTGVAYDHESLFKTYRGWVEGATYDHNYNWWDPYGLNPDEPQDGYYGTPTMGAMVGSDRPFNPGAGNYVLGMSPRSNWFTCQGFSDRGTGPAYPDALLECAEFVLAPWDLNGENQDPDQRADVVNNSWGIGQAQWWYNQVIYAWRAAGIFPVFAAGDDGPDCGTVNGPGDLLNALSVGATDVDDAIAPFSARGPAAISGAVKPDIVAPGVDIFSAASDGTYNLRSSTWLASPHVAGEVALIWSAVPALRGNVERTEQIIAASALPLLDDQCGGAGPPNNVYGQGRIDALEAVSMAISQAWDISWLETAPVSGTVAPAASLDVTLNFDSTGLPWGECFTGNLEFEFNDPYVGQALVPVEMCITECLPGPPPAPNLAGIANGDGDGDYLIDWSIAPCGDTYTLQEDDNAGFSSPTTRYTGPDTEHTIAAQEAGTWYYRVRASNPAGDGDWSNVESTSVMPQAPVLSPIANSDGDGDYLLDWNAVTGASSYSLEEDDDPAFTSPTVRYSGADSQFPITGQQAGTWYYRVRAINAGGAGPWSNTESVFVDEPLLNAPVLSAIDNQDGDGAYLVDWSTVTGATGYILEEDDNPGFMSPGERYSGAGSQYQITSQTSGTWYYRVRATSVAGSSPWSNVESVAVNRIYLPIVARDG